MRFIGFLLVLLTLIGCKSKSPPCCHQKIALCCVATGKYDSYAKKMIESARQYFLKGYDVTYFLFTDGDIPIDSDVVVVSQDHLGWPGASLKRFHIYDKNRELFNHFDYIFAIDADMSFIQPVGEEILGRSVGVVRDVGYNISYEKNKRSRAYIKKKRAKNYYSGALYGGTRREFLKMVHKLKRQVNLDLSWGYIAIWHDESHLNRYFLEHPPQVCLDPSYCYLGNRSSKYEPKVIAIDKMK